MNPIKYLTDDELQDILNGCVDGVYPTTQEVTMANELITVRAKIKELESDAHINEIKAQGIEEAIKKADDKSYLHPIGTYLARLYIAELKRYVETLRAKHD